MKLSTPIRGILVMLAIFISFKSQAQHSQVFLGTGLATIQGETTDEFFFADELGMHFSSKYLYSLANEQFVFYGEASHTSAELYRQFSSKEGLNKFFYNKFNQTYLGAGMRFYLNKSINKINPYNGQILPYVALSLGVVNTSRDINIHDNRVNLQFKSPPTDPMKGYKVTTGTNVEVTGQLETGVAYVINSQFSLEVFGAGRPGFDDTWDGITGITDKNDWHLSGGVGLTYRLL